MQDRPAERLARYLDPKSGGGISTMTSIIADIVFVLVTTHIGNHRGEDRAKSFLPWKMRSLALLVCLLLTGNAIDTNISHYIVTGYHGCNTPTRWQARHAQKDLP